MISVPDGSTGPSIAPAGVHPGVKHGADLPRLREPLQGLLAEDQGAVGRDLEDPAG
jgi:hypothetical protein